MPYPFPDPAVTPEFEAENGVTYIWGGDKWVVKTFTSPTDFITPAIADTEYVRIDGTSTMTGNLTTTAGVYGMNLFSNNKAVATQEYVTANTLPKTGNITISGTATYTNQTPLSFEFNGSQNIQTKNGLLFYGLKADNNRPSWEACRIGIDPINENFSAFSTGKRFYWTGTYVYLNGSVRNYLNTSTWDFRDNDTNNNIVLSIDSAKAEYNGAITTNKSIATKEYVDAIKTAAATATDFAEFKTLIADL